MLFELTRSQTAVDPVEDPEPLALAVVTLKGMMSPLEETSISEVANVPWAFPVVYWKDRDPALVEDVDAVKFGEGEEIPIVDGGFAICRATETVTGLPEVGEVSTWNVPV